MNTNISIIFAWLSLLMIIMLCSLFPLVRINNKYAKLKNIAKKLHKPLGVLIIVMMLVHGKLSGVRPGIEAIMILVFSLLLALSYGLRKKHPNAWMLIHHAFTILLLITLMIHLVIAFI